MDGEVTIDASTFFSHEDSYTPYSINVSTEIIDNELCLKHSSEMQTELNFSVGSPGCITPGSMDYAEIFTEIADNELSSKCNSEMQTELKAFSNGSSSYAVHDIMDYGAIITNIIENHSKHKNANIDESHSTTQPFLNKIIDELDSLQKQVTEITKTLTKTNGSMNTIPLVCMNHDHLNFNMDEAKVHTNSTGNPNTWKSAA